MVQIDVLDGDIATKEAQLVQTQSDLETAIANRDKQYADMKTRITYLYENGGNGAWLAMMLNAENLSELLNKAEYIFHSYMTMTARV